MLPSYSRSYDFFPVDGCVHWRLPSASSVKLATVLGASFSNRRTTTLPSDVFSVAYSPGWRAIFLSSFRALAMSGGAVLRALHMTFVSLCETLLLFATKNYFAGAFFAAVPAFGAGLAAGLAAGFKPVMAMCLIVTGAFGRSLPLRGARAICFTRSTVAGVQCPKMV